MNSITIVARTRTALGKQTKKLRTEGQIPAVLYGKGSANQNLLLSRPEFEKAYAKAGDSTLVDVVIDGGEVVKSLIHDYQKDPVRNEYTHVDLYRVNMNEKIRAELALHFVGESPAVKEFGGILVKGLSKLHIECLPKDLISHLDVDLSQITQVDKPVLVSDLNLPESITVKNEPHEIIARVTVIKEESPVTETVAVSAADVPVVEKEKKAEESEGAAAGAETGGETAEKK